MAAPAGAHHPEVEGSAYCAADGSISIDYTASTWTSSGLGQYIAISDIGNVDEDDLDANGDEYQGWVELSYTVSGGSAVVFDDLIEFVRGDTSDSGTITGFDASDFPVTIFVDDFGRWKNNGGTGGTNLEQTYEVSAPTQDCTPPVECEPGETAGDDTCDPVVCEPGETGSDSGGNEVDDTCDPVVCEPGETPSDSGDNDVNDTCLPIVCEPGESGSDSGANGVGDTCDPIVCESGETGSDSGTNGVDDTCDPIVCESGETGSDSGTNGVDDTCTEVLDDTVTPPQTPAPAVLDNTTVTPTAQPAPAVQTGTLALTGAGSTTLALGAAMLLLLGIGLTLAGKEFAEA